MMMITNKTRHHIFRHVNNIEWPIQNKKKSLFLYLIHIVHHFVFRFFFGWSYFDFFEKLVFITMLLFHEQITYLNIRLGNNRKKNRKKRFKSHTHTWIDTSYHHHIKLTFTNLMNFFPYDENDMNHSIWPLFGWKFLTSKRKI